MSMKDKVFGKCFFMFSVTVLFLLGTYNFIFCEEQKKPMKILMVVSEFPKIHDTCMVDQMTGLIDRGHDVHIFASRKGDCVHVQEDIITYDLINKTIFRKLPASLDEYDVIVFQLGHKLFDVRKKHNYKGKIVVCFLGYDITGYLKKNPHAYDNYFKTCDHFLPVCDAFKKLLEKEGCPSNKITVLHTVIDCSKFTFDAKELPQEGPINIVSAGRFVEKKGFAYSIRAIAQLVKKYPRIRYTLIGNGVLKDELKQLIKKLKIEDKVQFYDWLTHDKYIDVLKQSHMFILSSVTAKNNDQEGIPGVLKEAMAVGLPVIGTTHSGNPELIEHGVSGLLVPERDSYAISKAVEYLLEHPQEWAPMQLAARNKVDQEFHKEIENDKLEAILYSLVQK